MIASIMQPYFLPYIGYFQLIAVADVFVVYDNIKYTKKGWINRNRLLANGEASVFSVPLQKASDALDVRERHLAHDFDRRKLLNVFKGAYGGAPCFKPTMTLLESIIGCTDTNLFGYVQHSLSLVCAHLNLETRIVTSSDLPIDHQLRSQEKVIALCRSVGASVYVNPVGGTSLYADEAFREQGVELRFLRSRPVEYRQFGAPFVPWLSIVDLLMFNPRETVEAWVKSRDQFDLLSQDLEGLPQDA